MKVKELPQDSTPEDINWGRTNQKSRLFPDDELHIPLSIFVPPEFRTEYGVLDKGRYTVDKHHRFAPKKALIHNQGDLGKILRYSCFQNVPKKLHSRFNRYYDEPLLPQTPHAKFGAILLSIARYLPAEAIDVSGEEPVRRELSLLERQRIWVNNELKPEQGSKVQREILNYITSRQIDNLDESLLERFINSRSEEVRIETGKKLFRIATEVAVEPIETAYVDAWESQLLPRQDIRAETGRLYDLTQARAVPKRPTAFVLRHVIKDKYALDRSLNHLQTSLTARYAA